LGANGWDEGNVIIATGGILARVDYFYSCFFPDDELKWGFLYSLVRIPLESLLFRTIVVA
jgi:hypothetical protein